MAGGRVIHWFGLKNVVANYRRLVGWTKRDAAFEPRLSRRRGLAVFCLSGLAIASAAIIFDPQVPGMAGKLPPWSADASLALTRLGKADWILVPVGGFLLAMFLIDWTSIGLHRRLFWIQGQISAAFIFLSVAGSGIAADIIKQIVGRARPSHFAIEGPYAFHPIFADASYASFPSAHATTIAAFATAIAMLRPKLAVPAFFTAVLVAISRLMLGAHYPSDVLAGLALGSIFTIAVADWMSRCCLTAFLPGRSWRFVPRPRWRKTCRTRRQAGR